MKNGEPEEIEEEVEETLPSSVFVTPAEAKAHWLGMMNPTPTKVSRALFTDGKYAPPSIIEDWAVAGWAGKPFQVPSYVTHFAGLFDVKARSQHRMFVAFQKMVDRATRTELVDMTDDTLLRTETREMGIAIVTLLREITRNKRTLVTTMPKDAGALVKALSEMHSKFQDGYDRVIGLAERSMKMIEETKEEPSSADPIPEADPLATEIANWGRIGKVDAS